jgi:hypothetical protein
VLECTVGSVATPSDHGAGTCESCGATEPEESLLAVHRVYLQTDDQGRVIGESVVLDVERWCLSCRSLYPHKES